MNILKPTIKKKIQTSIIDRIINKEYNQMIREISDVLVELYTGIPDKNAFHTASFTLSRS